MKEQSFAEMFEESNSLNKEYLPGEEVEVKIVEIDSQYLFLDLGTRVEGILDKKEIIGKEKLQNFKVGDFIKAFIVKKQKGAYLCTTKKSSQEQKVDSGAKRSKHILDAYDNNLAVKGMVESLNKGGFEVKVKNSRCFCPISQIDNSYCENPESFVGKSFLFKVIKYEENGNNIVLSRRALLEEERKEKTKNLMQNIEVGNIVTGIVKTIKDYGAFIDIGGVEGLMHISEMSWQRIENLQNHLKVGDSVKVKIISIDEQNTKISLSIKALEENPAEKIFKELEVGNVFKGKVTKLKPFGAFIEIKKGVEALLHISNFKTENRIAHPKEVLKIGEEINVVVTKIDKENKKISLEVHEEHEDYAKELNSLQEKPSEVSSNTLADQLDSFLKK